MRTLFELREELVMICKMLYDKNLVSATDGNVSIRIDEDRMLVTPSGVNKRLLREDMILLVDFEGRVLEGSLRSSKEIGLHSKIYRDRPDVNAVVHTHPPYSTAFAVAHEPIKSNYLIETLVLLGDIALAPYGTPGTEEVPNSIDGLASDHDAILLKNHGVVTYGKDLVDAFNKMEALENVAKTIILSKIAGTPKEIPLEKVNFLKELQKRKGK